LIVYVFHRESLKRKDTSRDRRAAKIITFRFQKRHVASNPASDAKRMRGDSEWTGQIPLYPLR